MLRKFSKLLRLLGTRRYRIALQRGTAAALEHEALIKRLSIQTFIDVGANKGQFSLLVRNHHSKARIYGIEPLPEPGNTYEALFEDDTDTVLFRCAAGARRDTLSINLSGRTDSSSILQITSAQEKAFPGTAHVGSQLVSVEPLDELIDPEHIVSPLLIKLDVQGYEVEALKGMPLLMAKADYLYVELSFQPLYAGQPLASDVLSWLAAEGFDLAIVNDVTRSSNGISVQADVLFVKRGVEFDLWDRIIS